MVSQRMKRKASSIPIRSGRVVLECFPHEANQVERLFAKRIEPWAQQHIVCQAIKLLWGLPGRKEMKGLGEGGRSHVEPVREACV